MVLMGVEPMTMRWGTCQSDLKASRQPLDQTCWGVSGLRTRVDIRLDYLNLKKIKNTREACSSCLISRNPNSSSNLCFSTKLSEIKIKLDRFFITNMNMYVNFIYFHPSMFGFLETRRTLE